MRTSPLRILVLVVAISGFVWAKSHEKLPPLRYPFGLTLLQSPEEVQSRLQAKGLILKSQTQRSNLRELQWELSHQIRYQEFVPAFATTTFVDKKLSVFALSTTAVADCKLAERTYGAALAFLNNNYATEKMEVRQEPTTDTIDCGPHFQSETYRLELANKDFLVDVLPVRSGPAYRVVIMYRSRALLPPEGKEKEDDETPPDAHPDPQLLQNL